MDNEFVWIAIAVVAVVLFGGKRLPDAARGIGRSLRIFKAETKGLVTDDQQQAPQQGQQQGQLPAGYQQAPQGQQFAQPGYQQPVYQQAPQPMQPVPSAEGQPAPAPAPAPAQPVERHDAP